MSRFVKCYHKRLSNIELRLPDPRAKLQSIWHCGAKENDADVIGKHNQNLLPHNPSLRKNKGMEKEEKRAVIFDFQH